MVNLDSPEAFEEILWKQFWPSYYKEDKILLWSRSGYPTFEDFFLDHMRKIILLRGSQDIKTRYISKNNFNIARVNYLASLFPEATILILFRSPLQHAASLLKQHLSFLSIHQEDSFARKYAYDAGHFDFGHNLRPVDFNRWLSQDNIPPPDAISFWLRYWINAYKYLLGCENDRIRFFSFDHLCQDPPGGIERLGRILDLEDKEPLLKNVDRIRIPEPHPVDTDSIDPDILNQAQELYQELQDQALLW